MSRNHAVGTGRRGCPSPLFGELDRRPACRLGGGFADHESSLGEVPIGATGAATGGTPVQLGQPWQSIVFQTRAKVSRLQSCRAFTLVEIMAVVVIISVLVAAVIGTAKYANLRIGIAQAKTQLAALQMGLELYKADVGYYPASTIVRFSYSGSAEISNAAILYRALTQSKRYYNARRSDIGADGAFTYFKDPWGTPWHYYHPVPSQLTSFLASVNAANASYYITNISYASFAVGGRKNLLTYDLYSYGPDTITTIPRSFGNSSWDFILRLAER